MKKLIILCALLVTTQVRAWTPNGQVVTIDQVVQWERNSKIVLILSSGHKCYIPADEDKVFSTVLAIYLAKAKASIHCHDKEENIGGYKARRLHRIILTQQ
jgi:hypothetical protein